MFGGRFPFFGGGQQGQGQSHGHDHHHRPEKPVDTQTFYNVLGVSKSATLPDIRKAYMTMARKEHPDKGGDEEKFKEITKAYETLSNPETRAIYDAHGEEGLKGRGGGGGGGAGGMPADFFAQMFGGMGADKRMQRGKDVVHGLTVSLEDVYKGKVLGAKLSREEPCTTCKASGCAEGAAPAVCAECNGKGVKLSMRQIGPMVQQVQTPCGKCHATGKHAPPSEECQGCLGKTTRPAEIVIDIVIERGMISGDKIVFAGKGTPGPDGPGGASSGDLIFVIQTTEHAFLRREGCDLVMQKKITLLEALTGLQFCFTHLDGKKAVVTSAPGDVIAPGDIRAFVGKGMPMRGNTFIKGDLFVQFDVIFPKPGAILKTSALALQVLLPGKEEDADRMEAGAEEDADFGTLSEVNLEAMQERAKQMRMQQEENEAQDAPPQGQGVQCAQQ